MKCPCPSTLNFFAHPAFKTEDIRAGVFFLIYHGKGGYTEEGVWRLDPDEFFWHINKLRSTLDEETRVHNAAVRAAQRRKR